MGTGSDDDAPGDFHRAAANDDSGSRAGADGRPEARIEDAAMRLAPAMRPPYSLFIPVLYLVRIWTKCL